MTQDLSQRARAILDAAEQIALGAQPHSAPPPPPPVAPPGAPSIVAVPGSIAAQLVALAEQMQRIATEVRERLAELTVTVDALARRVDTLQAAAPPPPAPMPVAPPVPPPRPAPAPVPRPAPEAGRDAAARLLAVELAVAGATRGDVDRRLRERFGAADTRLLLDRVFGPGSAPNARLPWGTGNAGPGGQVP